MAAHPVCLRFTEAAPKDLSLADARRSLMRRAKFPARASPVPRLCDEARAWSAGGELVALPPRDLQQACEHY